MYINAPYNGCLGPIDFACLVGFFGGDGLVTMEEEDEEDDVEEEGSDGAVELCRIGFFGINGLPPLGEGEEEADAAALRDPSAVTGTSMMHDKIKLKNDRN